MAPLTHIEMRGFFGNSDIPDQVDAAFERFAVGRRGPPTEAPGIVDAASVHRCYCLERSASLCMQAECDENASVSFKVQISATLVPIYYGAPKETARTAKVA
jgi:hypothetical protein